MTQRRKTNFIFIVWLTTFPEKEIVSQSSSPSPIDPSGWMVKLTPDLSTLVSSFSVVEFEFSFFRTHPAQNRQFFLTIFIQIWRPLIFEVSQNFNSRDSDLSLFRAGCERLAYAMK